MDKAVLLGLCKVHPTSVPLSLARVRLAIHLRAQRPMISWQWVCHDAKPMALHGWRRVGCPGLYALRSLLSD